jgi:hypothetical protein
MILFGFGVLTGLGIAIFCPNVFVKIKAKVLEIIEKGKE